MENYEVSEVLGRQVKQRRESIEIYRGGSEIPGEFGGSGSGCGVIAIWTKSYP